MVIPIVVMKSRMLVKLEMMFNQTEYDCMDAWEEVTKCKECGAFPFIFKIGRKKHLMCDHGKQQAGVKGYESTAEWNAAQQRKDGTDND